MKIFKVITTVVVIAFTFYIGYCFGDNKIEQTGRHSDSAPVSMKRNYAFNNAYLTSSDDFNIKNIYLGDTLINSGTTHSMRPTMDVGDISIMDTTATAKEGDIIAFECNSKKCSDLYSTGVEHRWVSTKKDGCMVILGDYNEPKGELYYQGGVPCFYPDDIKIAGVVKTIIYR